MNRFIILLFILFAGLRQTVAQDSLYRLSEERFVAMLLKYHPVAKQGDLITESGTYKVKMARGKFDPNLFARMDEKKYEDKEYFNLLGTGLKIPAWLGMDFKLGYDLNTGDYLNPEHMLPENGLIYGGISVPLGEGLFIDERRKVLRQAELFSDYTRVEKERLLNDLLLEALKSYWNWVRAFNQLQIYRDFVELAQERFTGIRRSYELGDLPAIDTLEAHIQVQNRKIGENQSIIEFRTAALELSNFLWYENDIPLEISESLVPLPVSEFALDSAISQEYLNSVMKEIENNHPELQLYEYKLADLQIEEAWKREKIKPTLNLNYNFLNEAGGPPFEGMELSNHKWGFEFSMPLLFRSEVGDLRLTQIKMKEMEFNRSMKSREISNKALTYYQQLLNLIDQVALYGENVTSYERLLEGERKKFEAGESSLFLLNSREIGFIDARIKQLDVRTKTRVTYLSYFWASGVLFDEFSGDES